MTALTLRLEPKLANNLDRFCKKTGYKKTGLIKSLIQRFLERQKNRAGGKSSSKSIHSLVGVVRLGGDAAREESYFE